MKFLPSFTAALIAVFTSGCFSGTGEGKFSGTWLCTHKFSDYPRCSLKFRNNQEIFVENVLDEPFTVKYKKVENDYSHLDLTNSEKIEFEHEYKDTRPNGNIVDRTLNMGLLYHEEDGLPIISVMGFEFDGRGIIVLEELLPEDRLVDGFKSKLAHRLNDRPAGSTMRRME